MGGSATRERGRPARILSGCVPLSPEPSLTPHRISLRHSARLLRLPLRGGVLEASTRLPVELYHSPLEGESVRQGLRPQSSRWGGRNWREGRNGDPARSRAGGAAPVSEARKRPLLHSPMIHPAGLGRDSPESSSPIDAQFTLMPLVSGLDRRNLRAVPNRMRPTRGASSVPVTGSLHERSSSFGSLSVDSRRRSPAS